MSENKITLPYNYQPRDYQRPVLQALDSGYKRVVVIAHRRWGKDKMCINHVAREMFRRVGGYYYVLPTYAQGQKVIWDGRDRDGFKFTDHIPQQLRIRTDNSNMKIEVIKPVKFMTDDEKLRHEAGEKIPGSLFQVIGSDNINSIVGANPVGLVFSEWALQDPAAWDYLRPILAENGGWAMFIYTVRGKNHGWTTAQIAQKYPQLWAYFNQTVEDTHAIPNEVLVQERLEIIEKDGNDDLYMQEYMNDFGIAIKGAYYGDNFRRVDNEGRICAVPYDPNALVHTAWDLGADSMKVWFIQRAGKEFHAIDFMENVPGGMIEYIKQVRAKEYQYGKHFAPHDIKAKEITNDKSRYDTAKGIGFEFEVVKNIGVDNGIDAVRGMLSRFWFDAEKTANGVSALKSYHKDWDEKLQTFKDNPKHDWASHASDALRIFAVGYNDSVDQIVDNNTSTAESYEIEFDPYE